MRFISFPANKNPPVPSQAKTPRIREMGGQGASLKKLWSQFGEIEKPNRAAKQSFLIRF